MLANQDLRLQRRQKIFHQTFQVLSLTNFEVFYAIRSVIVLFFVTLSRRTIGFSVITDPEVSLPLPRMGIMISAVKWVFLNLSYVMSKRKQIKNTRKLKTSDLIKKGLISKFN